MQCWFWGLAANSKRVGWFPPRHTIQSNVASRKFLQVAFDQQPKRLTLVDRYRWNGTWFPPLSNRIPQLRRWLHLNAISAAIRSFAGQTSSILRGKNSDLLQLHSRGKRSQRMCHPDPWTTLRLRRKSRLKVLKNWHNDSRRFHWGTICISFRRFEVTLDRHFEQHFNFVAAASEVSNSLMLSEFSIDSGAKSVQEFLQKPNQRRATHHWTNRY